MANDREQSAERIEQAATDLFARHGYDAVGVRDIARMASVPVSAINYYFGSKEALYRECTRKLTAEYLSEARARLSAGADLNEVMSHYLDTAGRDSKLTKLWLDLQLSGDAEARAYSSREVLGPMWQILSEALARDGASTTDRRLEALSFVGAVVLDAVLADDQIESLLGEPSSQARSRWRGEILERLVATRRPTAPAGEMFEPGVGIGSGN